MRSWSVSAMAADLLVEPHGNGARFAEIATPSQFRSQPGHLGSGHGAVRGLGRGDHGRRRRHRPHLRPPVRGRGRQGGDRRSRRGRRDRRRRRDRRGGCPRPRLRDGRDRRRCRRGDGGTHRRRARRDRRARQQRGDPPRPRATALHPRRGAEVASGARRERDRRADRRRRVSPGDGAPRWWRDREHVVDGRVRRFGCVRRVEARAQLAHREPRRRFRHRRHPRERHRSRAGRLRGGGRVVERHRAPAWRASTRC